MSIELRTTVRTLSTVLVFVMSICYGSGRCSAQLTDGQHYGTQSSVGTKSATNTGSLVNDTGGVGGSSNSSASGSAKAPTAHSVSLSWKASVPLTDLKQDAIIGYIVYRSTKAHDRKAKPINLTRVTGTTFIDSDVKPGKTYYYVTRAVSASGKLSDPSNEASAEIPR